MLGLWLGLDNNINVLVSLGEAFINKSWVRVRECAIVLLVLGVELGLGNKYYPILEDKVKHPILDVTQYHPNSDVNQYHPNLKDKKHPFLDEYYINSSLYI